MNKEIQTPQEGTDAVPQDTSTPAQPSQPTVPAVDYEKKFKDSQRENELFREAEQARARAAQELTKEPTDSELRTAFPEWDSLSEFEKRIARDNLATKKIASSAAKSAQELREERAWNTSIELVVSSDPTLQGKEQAFRQFASQPKYKGVPMELLVSAFLQKSPADSPRPTPQPALLSGNGGPRTPEKPTTITTENLRVMRETDPRGYQDYLKSHPIENVEL
jgi:hypothetical protein